jgi:multidrug efflux pump subunit AcrB
VLLGDVADVAMTPADPTSYVSTSHARTARGPAVTLSIAKAQRDERGLVDASPRGAGRACPRRHPSLDVDVEVTRNYGETAADKSNELLWHMLLAVISVSVADLARARAPRGRWSLVAIPVTLALTLFVFYLYGYTLNRITLFALIFSIGILWTTRSWSSRTSCGTPALPVRTVDFVHARYARSTRSATRRSSRRWRSSRPFCRWRSSAG